MNKSGLIIVLMFLTGCTLIPAYHRPQLPVAGQWPAAAGDLPFSSVAAADIGWREFFQDPRLQKLIDLALQNNRDLRVATLNVEQVKDQYRIYGYALYPGVDASVTGLRQRSVSSSGGYSKSRKYTAAIDPSYEIDLFGHIRSLKAQALDQYFATQQAQKSAQITLVSELAIQYLNQRAIDEQLALLRQTLKSVQAYYQLIKSSYQLGNATELDLRSAQAQVETAKANIADYQRQAAQAADALEFLIGEPLPADLPDPQPLEAQHLLEQLPAGLPSDLLERRPDILEAEDQLKAANANIGVVRANFFPSIALTASDGTGSVQLAKLFTPGSQIWSFSPQLTLPIFDENTNAANLDAAHVAKSIQVAQYEKAVQSAFREVSDGLAARQDFNAQLAAQQALVQAEQKRYQLAGQRYHNGLDNYLTVLTAQQDLYGAQQNLIQLRFQQLSNLVSLYQALGGGWQE